MSDWKWSVHPTYEALVRDIDEMNCGVLAEDWAGCIVYANRRILEWSGYTPAELDGKPAELLVPEELHAQTQQERERVHDGDIGKRLSAFRRKDGRSFPIAISPQIITRADGSKPAVLCVIFDLGEVQAARPMGAPVGSLAAELAGVALKLQSLTFAAAVSEQSAVAVDHPALADLTSREGEILQLLMANSRVPVIAEKLCISPSTVRSHLKSIYRKIGVSSQSQLIERVRSLSARSTSD